MLCYTKTLKHTHARQIFSSRRWNVCCAEAKSIDKAFGRLSRKTNRKSGENLMLKIMVNSVGAVGLMDNGSTK